LLLLGGRLALGKLLGLPLVLTAILLVVLDYYRSSAELASADALNPHR
jgi:hypothetical protein